MTGSYKAWTAMRMRCLNPNASNFPNYGGRGITICDRWMKFDNFYADMGDRPNSMTLDRKNANGNYEPSNCRWADRTTQARNQRDIKEYLVDGIMGCTAFHCERLGLSYKAIQHRLKRGWSVENAYHTPIRKLIYTQA